MTTVADQAVQFMVPMAIQELREMTPADRERMTREWTSEAVADVLAGSGDSIQHGAPPKKATKAMHREAGDALAALAKAIAALSWRPGGIQLFGQSWCAQHSPMGARASGVCAGCVE